MEHNISGKSKQDIIARLDQLNLKHKYKVWKVN